MSRRSGQGRAGACGLRGHAQGVEGAGARPAERLPRRRVGAMSKAELAGRPEPGYESMEHFTVSVEHVAEMLRTIDFQPGEGVRMGGGGGPLGLGVPRGRGGGGRHGQRSRDPTSRGLPWG